MLIGVRRTRGVIPGLAVAASLLVGVVGCDSGGEEGGSEAESAAVAKSVAPGKLCGGTALSAGAGKELEAITGSSRFEASGRKATVAHAALVLTETFTSSTSGDGDVCRVYTPEGATGDELRITWHLSDKGPGDAAPASKYTVLDMGERAGTAWDGAFVDFACRSGELSGSEGSAAHIAVNIAPAGTPEEPGADAKTLKKAYATVAHSFALAMAKELGCEGDAGLQTQPLL